MSIDLKDTFSSSPVRIGFPLPPLRKTGRKREPSDDNYSTSRPSLVDESDADVRLYRDLKIGSYNGELGVYHGYNHIFIIIYDESISPVNCKIPFRTSIECDAEPSYMFVSIGKLINNQDLEAPKMHVYAPVNELNIHPPAFETRRDDYSSTASRAKIFAESDWVVACYNETPGIVFKEYPMAVLSVWCHEESLKQAPKVVTSPGKCLFVPVFMLLLGYAHVYEVLMDDLQLFSTQSPSHLCTVLEEQTAAVTSCARDTKRKGGETKSSSNDKKFCFARVVTPSTATTSSSKDKRKGDHDIERSNKPRLIKSLSSSAGGIIVTPIKGTNAKEAAPMKTVVCSLY